MARHPGYFESTTRAKINAEKKKIADGMIAGNRQRRETDETPMMPSDVPSSEWRRIQQRISKLNRPKEQDARMMGREHNFIWSFDYMSRTQPINEESTDVFSWKLPLNYEFQTAVEETAAFAAVALAARLAENCKDDAESFNTSSVAFLKSCEAAKSYCKKNDQFGAATRKDCPETCGACARIKAKGSGPGNVGTPMPPPPPRNAPPAGTFKSCNDAVAMPARLQQYAASCEEVSEASCWYLIGKVKSYPFAEICPSWCFMVTGCEEPESGGAASVTSTNNIPVALGNTGAEGAGAMGGNTGGGTGNTEAEGAGAMGRRARELSNARAGRDTAQQYNSNIFGIATLEMDENQTVTPDESTPFYDILDPNFGICYQFRPGRDLSVQSVGAGQPHSVNINTYVDAEQYLGYVEMVGTVITIHGENDTAYTGGRT